MAGLLGLNGISQLPGLGLLWNKFSGEPNKGGLLSSDATALLNPASMRRAQISQGLMRAGLAMMNPDPYAPPAGIGGIVGRAAAGGFQGMQEGKDDYVQDVLVNQQFADLERKNAQQKAIDKFIPSLPAELQLFAQAFPDKVAESYAKLYMPGGGEDFTLGPNQVRYGPGGKIIAKGGDEEPKYSEVTLEDGVYAVDLKTGAKHRIGERPNRNEGEGRDFTQEYKIREEYLKQAKPFADLRVNYQRIQAAANDNTGASDIAMVYSYMKMLDPTSVVREGEFATAQNAGGVDSQLIAMYNKLLSGERLAPQVRNEFMQQAGRQYEQQKASYGETRKMYQGLARQYQLDPERVAPDITYGVELAPQPGAFDGISDFYQQQIKPQAGGQRGDELRSKYGLRPRGQ